MLYSARDCHLLPNSAFISVQPVQVLMVRFMNSSLYSLDSVDNWTQRPNLKLDSLVGYSIMFTDGAGIAVAE